MSLEMIIGLLILLVVAAVVINLFLNNTKGIGAQQYKQALQYRNFKAQCDSLCNDYLGSGNLAGAAKFCFTKLTGDTDLNRNGKIDAFPADTKLLNICEDGIYCFHVTTCNSDTGKIDWPDCRQILCNAYYEVYQDYTKSNEKVKAIFPNGIGSCTLPSDSVNWYQLYFGNNPCTEGPSGTGGTGTTSSSANTLSIDCSKQGNNAVCSYSCPNQVSVQNPATIAIKPNPQGGSLTSPSGTYSFNNLISGTSYTVTLVCDPNQGAQLYAFANVQI